MRTIIMNKWYPATLMIVIGLLSGLFFALMILKPDGLIASPEEVVFSIITLCLGFTFSIIFTKKDNPISEVKTNAE